MRPSGTGYAARGSTNHHNLDMAEARARGMKLVVVDPICGFAASKANEWIPIRPGTDMAMSYESDVTALLRKMLENESIQNDQRFAWERWRAEDRLTKSQE